MSFQIDVELRYEVQAPSILLLNIHALPTANQVLQDEVFTITEGSSCEFFPLQEGTSRYVRIDTGTLSELTLTYSVTARTNPDARRIESISQVPVGDLDQSALQFLFPSRYCQSDRLGLLARKRFGNYPHPLEQAAAISEWIFNNIDYQPGLTNPSTSACDTLVQRAGVCRDFAHLGIAICRALSIPARYFSGYACGMQPQDFHACFEVWVGNDWFIFDPTRLSSPNGLVRIATGRDAADVSVATLFGPVNLISTYVNCTSRDYSPMQAGHLQGKAVVLEP